VILIKFISQKRYLHPTIDVYVFIGNVMLLFTKSIL